MPVRIEGSVRNAGNFSPSIDTPLSIGGDLVMEATSQMGVYLGAPAVQVDGRAALDGTLRVMGSTAAYVPDSDAQVLTADGGVTGTFSTVTWSSPTVDATVQVRLSDADGGTRIDYDAEAIVGGMIGGVGQRMLTAVAKKTAAEFFSAVENHLLAPVAEEVAAVAAPTASTAEPALATAQTFERPQPAPAAPRYTTVPPWTMLAAFGMGAGIALGSAAIGWLLGHGYRRR